MDRNGLFQKDFFLPRQEWEQEGSSALLQEESKVHTYKILLSLVLLSFVLKLLYLIPGMSDASLYLRVDSFSYLNPAKSLLYDFTYSTNAASNIPALHRTPVYPLFLAFSLGISKGSLLFCAVFSAVISSLTLIPLYLSARMFLKEKYAVIAASLYLLHPTVFAIFPLIISDTLFVFFTSFTMYFFLSFLQKRFLYLLLVCAGTASLAVLTRPLMLFWCFPAIFVLFFLPAFPVKKKMFHSLLFLLIFALLPTFWLLRNYHYGAGWRIDIVSADTAKHNVSTFESRRNNIPAAVLREQYDKEAEETFRKDPEKYASYSSRLSFHEERLAKTMKKYPFSYFFLHFRPVVLIPDGASFFENLRLTSTGKNTFDVINRKGIIAGICHYFKGKLFLPFLASPLFLLAGTILLSAAAGIVIALWKKCFFTLLLFLLFCEYFLFMTGPVAMPRYQLPALPFLCILASGTLEFCGKFFRKKA